MKHALLRTLPGRAIVIGAAVKLIVFALTLVTQPPGVIRLLDTVASVTLVAAGAYFLARGLALAQRRLLWRVRRKLIISYVFIGFVPAILIVAFFLLGGLLLFSNFSSYLLQTRLQSLTQQAQAIAATTAVEIQRAGGRGVASIAARRQAAVVREFPGASIAVVPLDRPCENSDAAATAASAAASLPPPLVAGSWAHVEPPRQLPTWVSCSGFQGLLAYANLDEPIPARAGTELTIQGQRGGRDVDLVARAIVMPDSPAPTYAVIVDLLVNGPMRDELRSETGVELTTVRTLSGSAPILRARHEVRAPEPSDSMASLPGVSASFPEVVDWATGETRSGTVVASMQLSISEMYARMAAAQGAIGQGLLFVLMAIGVLFLIIEAIALVAGLALARSITGSVHELFAGTERVRLGDFTHKIAIHARDQLGELAESFNSMTSSIEDLLRVEREKKRLEDELRIAHDIQMSLLPQGPLDFPGVSVTSVCVPAREVGGDYFDILPLDEHRVGILIADVSGKGTSAALYMAEMKGLMLSLSRNHSSPRELLITANTIIAEHLNSRSFITMIYAIIDTRARTLTYARAGHTPLLSCPGPKSPEQGLRLLAPDGMVLGLNLDNGAMFERLLEEQTLSITDGDIFLLYTDGISEAMNAADDCFGEDRLSRIVEEHAHLPSDELRERILREIAAFVGDAPQHDDMTMILLRIDETAAARRPATPEVELAPL
ncbi:MAG TPA: PP2C family protein-serine/threonine phosphatase [Vicinamibacterales bacterium]|nr:PP2C family protein-serine/threonine phosphatase [Vicinamibacterales bacterium]